MDRLGIQQEFYEIVLIIASGENPENVVMTARTSYLEYTFSADDLMDKLNKGCLKECVKSTTPRDPSHPKDILATEVDQEIEIVN